MKRLLPLILLFSFSIPAAAQPITATTADGKKVILHPDGRWEYQQVSTKTLKYTTPSQSRKPLKGKTTSYTLWYDPGKWEFTDQIQNDFADYKFRLKNQDAFAHIIADREENTPQFLRAFVLHNAKSISSDFKLVKEEKRIVNGKEILCIKFDVVVDKTTVSYYNYYYTGKNLTLQMLTFTTKTDFPKFEKDFENFLNGIVIN